MDKKGTILVVDDSPVDFSMLTEVLTFAGFAVSQAGSGELVKVRSVLDGEPIN